MDEAQEQCEERVREAARQLEGALNELLRYGGEASVAAVHYEVSTIAAARPTRRCCLHVAVVNHNRGIYP